MVIIKGTKKGEGTYAPGHITVWQSGVFGDLQPKVKAYCDKVYGAAGYDIKLISATRAHTYSLEESLKGGCRALIIAPNISDLSVLPDFINRLSGLFLSSTILTFEQLEVLNNIIASHMLKDVHPYVFPQVVLLSKAPTELAARLKNLAPTFLYSDEYRINLYKVVKLASVSIYSIDDSDEDLGFILSAGKNRNVLASPFQSYDVRGYEIEVV